MSQTCKKWEMFLYQDDSEIGEIEWETWRLKVPGGYLYKTVDTFEVTDRDKQVAMIDKKVTVTFVPELKC